MNAPARSCIPLYETVATELACAINTPGLAHIKVSVKICQGAERVSASIDFAAPGEPCLVSLLVNSDNSFVLVERNFHGDPENTTWTSEDAGPDTIKPVVLAALRRRVIETVGL